MRAVYLLIIRCLRVDTVESDLDADVDCEVKPTYFSGFVESNLDRKQAS